MRKHTVPQETSAKFEEKQHQFASERQRLLKRLTALIDSVKNSEKDDMGRRKTRNSRKSPNVPSSADRSNTETVIMNNVVAPPKMASFSDSPNSAGSVEIDTDNQFPSDGDESLNFQSQPAPNVAYIDSTCNDKLPGNTTMPNLSFYPVPPADDDARTPARRPEVIQPNYSSTPIQRADSRLPKEGNPAESVASPRDGMDPNTNFQDLDLPTTQSENVPPPPSYARSVTSDTNTRPISPVPKPRRVKANNLDAHVVDEHELESPSVAHSSKMMNTPLGNIKVKSPNLSTDPTTEPISVSAVPAAGAEQDSQHKTPNAGSESEVPFPTAHAGARSKTDLHSQQRQAKEVHFQDGKSSGVKGIDGESTTNDHVPNPKANLDDSVDIRELLLGVVHEVVDPVANALKGFQRDIGDLTVRSGENSGMVRQLDNRMTHSELNTAKLNKRVNALELRERASTLFFDKIPEGANSAKQDILSIINDKLGLGIQAQEIPVCFRVGPAEPNKRRPILARFNSPDIKDKIYSRRREFKTKVPGVFIREHLTEVNKIILQKAKLLKGNGLINAWTIGGIVQILLPNQNKPKKIYHTDELPRPVDLHAYQEALARLGNQN